jgi:hypothetical protein
MIFPVYHSGRPQYPQLVSGQGAGFWAPAPGFIVISRHSLVILTLDGYGEFAGNIKAPDRR